MSDIKLQNLADDGTRLISEFTVPRSQQRDNSVYERQAACAYYKKKIDRKIITVKEFYSFITFIEKNSFPGNEKSECFVEFTEIIEAFFKYYNSGSVFENHDLKILNFKSISNILKIYKASLDKGENFSDITSQGYKDTIEAVKKEIIFP